MSMYHVGCGLLKGPTLRGLPQHPGQRVSKTGQLTLPSVFSAEATEHITAPTTEHTLSLLSG